MSLDLGDKVMSISGSLSDAEMKAAGLPSAGRLRFGGILSILGSISALTLLVLTLVRKERIPTAGLVTFSLFALAVIFYPAFENGPPADLTPRTQAMIAAAFALLGALGSMMVKLEADRSSRDAALSAIGEQSSALGALGEQSSALGAIGEHSSALSAIGEQSSALGAIGERSSALGATGERSSALSATGRLAALAANDDFYAIFSSTREQSGELSSTGDHYSQQSG